MKINKTKLALLTGVMVLGGFAGGVNADEKTPLNTGLGVAPELSERQNPADTGYIYESIMPDKPHTLKFRVNNPTKEEMKVGWNVTGAYTTSTGLAYNPYPEREGLEKEYDLSNYVEKTEGVETLAPGEKRTVEVVAKVPNLEGELLGAVHFWDESYKDQKVEEGNVGLQYKFDYVQAVRLYKEGTNPKNDIKSEIEIKGVTPTVKTSGLSLELEIQNKAPKVDGFYGYHYEVKKNEGGKPTGKAFFEGNMNDIIYAPKSTMFSLLKWNNNIKAGKYFLVLNDSDGKHLKDLPFEIKNDDIKKLEKTVDNEKIVGGIPTWVYILIAVISALVVGMGGKMYYDKKKEKKGSDTVEQDNSNK